MLIKNLLTLRIVYVSPRFSRSLAGKIFIALGAECIGFNAKHAIAQCGTVSSPEHDTVCVIDNQNISELSRLEQLLATADIVVDAPEHTLGEQFPSIANNLREINPKIVRVTLSRYEKEPPQRVLNLSQHNTYEQVFNHFLSNLMLSAIMQSRETHMGLDIDLQSFEEEIIDFIRATHAQVEASSSNSYTLNSEHPFLAPYQVFMTSDGEISIAVSENAQFAALCQVLQRPKLALDARFANNSARVNNKGLLATIITECLAVQSTRYWLSRFNEVGVPCAIMSSANGDYFQPENVLQMDLFNSVSTQMNEYLQEKTPITCC